jgi:hypothetical protein
MCRGHGLKYSERKFKCEKRKSLLTWSLDPAQPSSSLQQPSWKELEWLHQANASPTGDVEG